MRTFVRLQDINYDLLSLELNDKEHFKLNKYFLFQTPWEPIDKHICIQHNPINNHSILEMHTNPIELGLPICSIQPIYKKMDTFFYKEIQRLKNTVKCLNYKEIGDNKFIKYTLPYWTEEDITYNFQYNLYDNEGNQIHFTTFDEFITLVKNADNISLICRPVLRKNKYDCYYVELKIVKALITKELVKFNYDYKYISSFKLPLDLKIEIKSFRYKPEYLPRLIEEKEITTFHLFKNGQN